MAENPIPSPLPADLPTNWTYGQTVAPTGAEAGLATQYGYNYLMAAVNAAQNAVNTISQAFLQLATTGDLSSLSSSVSNIESDLSSLQTALDSLSGVVNAHIESKDNPHEVTAQQTGAATVDNPIIVTFSTSLWSAQSDGSYTQSVSCSGLQTTDDYRTRVEPVGNASDPAAQELTDQAYSCVNYFACNTNGQLFARASTQPKVNFNVAVVIIR